MSGWTVERLIFMSTLLNRANSLCAVNCVNRGGRLSINNRQGGGAAFEACHCDVGACDALVRSGEGCPPRKYELVSDDESVSESESESLCCRCAASDMCVSNPSVGRAKVGVEVNSADGATARHAGGSGDGDTAAISFISPYSDEVDGGKLSP